MSQPIGFDYSSISPADRKTVAQHAQAITNHLRSSSGAMIDIGRRLLEVREVLHTVFRAWILAEFKWSRSTAQNYMQCAEKFGDLDCLDYFQPSALTLLSRNAIPEAAVKKAIEHARSGQIVSKTMAKELIARFKVDRFRSSGSAPASSTTSETRGLVKAQAMRNVTSLFGSLKTMRTNLDEYSSQMSDDQRKKLADELQALAYELLNESIIEGDLVTSGDESDDSEIGEYSDDVHADAELATA